MNYLFLDELKTVNNIDKIILFGSRAKNTHQERSDIDLAIWCPQATLADWNKIMDIALDADTLLKIDCVRVDSMSKNNPLREQIESEGQVIFSKS